MLDYTSCPESCKHISSAFTLKCLCTNDFGLVESTFVVYTTYIISVPLQPLEHPGEEVFYSETPNKQGSTFDLQRTAHRIVRVAQILYHLDQVRQCIPAITYKGQNTVCRFLIRKKVGYVWENRLFC